MSEHAPIAPSSASRIVVCHGSMHLESLYPEDTESDHAREGTAAHWALSEVLNGRTVAEGQCTPEGFVLTREMAEGAEAGERWLFARIAEHDGEIPSIFIEERIAINRVHPQCWGTPDLVVYFPIAQVVYVYDYKFGHGWVEVFENWQLICYLAGVLEKFNVSGAANNTLCCRLVIHQPRSYHPDGPIRQWEITPTQARPYIVRMGAAAMAALESDPKLQVSDECGYCKARHACPALQADGLRYVDRSRSAVPFDLPPHALGIELADVRRAIKALEARETGLAGQAEALIRRGERVPFWAMQSKPGALAWTVPAAEVLALGEMLGTPLAKPTEPITPTQAAAKGFDPGMLEVYAARPAGPLKLVAQDDDDARRIFGDAS